MSDRLVVADGLGKAYRTYRSELERFATWLGFRVRAQEEKWVLRNVSFALGRGDAVGIVGQNGAGKSTLLKLITGTTRPSEGSVSVTGRVSAILELGMGFNPDLTGRDNVYHAAGLMGFSRPEIDGFISELRAFAEIGDAFDAPLRTYSSGMQMRVAFSVATAVRPDLLIVDEALSVGDAYFQHKSIARIREFQKQGTALLIVSHDREAVLTLCSRALLIEDGRLIHDGAPMDVLDFYNALIAEKEATSIRLTGDRGDGRTATVSGSGQAEVAAIGLYDARGREIETASVGQEVELRIAVHVNEAVPRLVMGYMIRDRLGQCVFGTNTHHTDQALDHVEAGTDVVYAARFRMNVGPGSYSVSTALVSTDTHLVDNYEWKELALVFSVVNLEEPYFLGVSWLRPDVRVSCE